MADNCLKTILTGIIVSAIWFAGSTEMVFADNSGQSTTETVLKIRGNEDFAPYEFNDANGAPAGYNVDLMKAIGRVMDLKLDIRLGPWAEVRSELQQGQIDALIGVLYSKDRDTVFDFSVFHISISYAIFVRKDSPIKGPEDVKGKEVIVVKNVYAHDWLKQNRFASRVITVDRPQEALQLLSKGRHDCAVLIRLHGLDLMRELKIENLQTVGPPVLTQKMGFAVHSGNADLLSKLNEGLYILQTSREYDKIYLKWFSTTEQRKTMTWLIRVGKLVIIPLTVFLALAGLLIWYLNKLVERRTRALQSREWLLNRIVQGTPVPTLVSDPDGKITHWNRSCETLSGIPAESVLGQAFGYQPERIHNSVFLSVLADRLTDKDELKLFRRRMKKAESLTSSLGSEVYVPWLGENGRWLYGTVAHFDDEQGNRLGIIETWQDLTERKRLEKRLLQAQRLESMGTLARGVAHDFNNYLQSILSFTELTWREAPQNSPIRDHMNQIQQFIRSARALISQILTFGRENLEEPEPVVVQPIVEKTLKLIEPVLPEGICIRRTVTSRAMIMADATKVGQVVMNLCTNALQAMEGGSGVLAVALKEVELIEEDGFVGQQSRSGSFLELSVSDTGKGIEEAHLDRIFEPFFTLRKQNGGTGMGLAIVHGIVRGYGGKISVSSTPGQGSTFEVLWPIIEMDDARSHPKRKISVPDKAQGGEKAEHTRSM